jgi:sortase A
MILRDVVGYAFLIVGTASVATAGGSYAAGEWRRAEARRTWEESQARAIVARAHALPTDAGVSDPISRGAPVAHLLIPRLGLDEIVLEGVDDYSLNAGPGHLPGSALPGQTGNAVISAHRDRHFARLGEIRLGDTVITELGSHKAQWVVTARRVVGAGAPAIFRTTDATLTLTTCWPIRYLGTAPERLLVTAKRVSG